MSNWRQENPDVWAENRRSIAGYQEVEWGTPGDAALSIRAVRVGRDVRAGKAPQKQRFVGLIDVVVPVQLGPLAGWVVLRNTRAAQAGLEVSEVGRLEVVSR